MNLEIVLYTILGLVCFIFGLLSYFLMADTLMMVFFLLYAAHMQSRVEMAKIKEKLGVF